MLALAAVATVAGVWSRSGDALEAFSLGGAAGGIASELSTTLPAATLVTLAMALDLAAGAALMRLLRRAPFASWTDVVLGAYAGAVVLDLMLLFTLGGAGLYRAAALVAVLVPAIIAGARAGPLCSRPPRPGRVRPARWLLVGVVWSGPILLLLASPVVPFADVLPNHVAPAEHLRVFGGIESLATYPSPVYGPSRLFLGYTAVMGTLSTLTGLPAALTVAASAGWLVVISAASARRLASAVFGAEAGFWALLAFPLTFTFVRLSDVRDSVAALPLAALSLALLVGPTLGRRSAIPPGRPDWLLGAAMTATAFVHPLVGTLTALTVAIVAVADPRRHARRAAPALVGTSVALVPQLAVMVGAAPAPAWGIVALAAAAGAAIATAAAVERIAWSRISTRWATFALVSAATLVLALVAIARSAALAQAGGWVNQAFPALFIAGGLAVVGLAPSGRGGRRLLVAALAAGGTLLLVVAVGAGPSLVGDSLRYEIPKAVGYWLPWACVPAAAGLLAAASRWRVARPAGRAFVAAFLAIALLPFGSPAPNSVQASHAVADVLAYDLRTAERGYWQGYPDARRVVGAAGAQLLDFLDGEVAAGRLSASDRVLHVAASYEEWASVPIGVFSGIEETMVCEDAATTIFTAGGRIHPLADLAEELRAGFPYVVLEPAGLPASVRAAIVSAGYRTIFAGDSGEVFAAPGRSQPARP